MRTQEPPAPSEPDYESIESAVMETARGRWFLAEHARRHRLVETEVLRALTERLEAILRSVRPLDNKPNTRHPAPSPLSQIEQGFNFEPFLAAAPSVKKLAAPPATKVHSAPQPSELNLSGMTQAAFEHRDRRYVQQIALGADTASSNAASDRPSKRAPSKA
jgi:hypothetical protein